jgi:Flp pilus assembly protein TadB
LSEETGDTGGRSSTARASTAAECDDSRAHAQGSDAPLGEQRRWLAVSAACAVAAAVLLLTVGVNAAFIAAVLGAVAWFWDQRNRIRVNLTEDDGSEEAQDEMEETDDEGGHESDAR